MALKKVLIVDDEDNIGRSLRLILEREGYAVSICRSVAEFRKNPDASRADAFLFDMRLPDGSGIDLLRSVQQNDSRAPAIMISGHGTIADAVEATRAGAFDFLEKPLSRDKVLLALKNALEHASLRRENERLRELVGTSPKMIGSSPAFLRAVEQASMAARSDARVLLIGESGTGKELLAEHIHGSSPFASGPFVKVNCAAIPTELIESELFGHEKGSFTGAAGMRRGKFELADGGTLFLDEIGDLHSASQAKLLRVLQEGEFHRVGGEQSIRVIGARDLGHQPRTGVAGGPGEVPRRPLLPRERGADPRARFARAAARHPAAGRVLPGRFLRAQQLQGENHLGRRVYPVLESYAWPGNARELRNAIERMAILTTGERLTREAIPVEIRVPRDTAARSSVQEARESAERDHILRALEESNWNVSGAARALGMERTNLHKSIRALGISREK